MKPLFDKARKRVASGLAKSLAIFIIADGAGAIAAFIISPFVAPYLTFLNIPIYGPFTGTFLLINGIVTFPIMAYLLKQTHVGQIDT